MSDLYVILHKVRGEPAFDIATPLRIGDEDGWIIPTSGHRAYPIEKWWISIKNGFPELDDAYPIRELPSELVDHYSCNAAPEPKSPPRRVAAASIDDIFNQL